MPCWDLSDPATKLGLYRTDLQRNLGHELVLGLFLQLFTSRDAGFQDRHIIQCLVNTVTRRGDGDFVG